MCQALADLPMAVNKIDVNPCLMKLSKTYPEKEREGAKKLHLIVYILLGLTLPSIPPFNCVKYIPHNNEVQSWPRDS